MRAALFIAAVLCVPVWAQPAKPPGPNPSREPPSAAAAVLTKASETGDFDGASLELDLMLDQAAAYADLSARGAFIEPARARRLIGLVRRGDRRAKDLLAGMLRAPEFADDLAFVIRERDRAKGVLAVADRLMQERAGDVAKFPGLAAAVCVVFDGERTWEFGKAPDAMEVFDYFVKNDAKLVMSTRTTPVELLVYVVDTLAPAAELEWARGRYPGAKNLAKAYSDVPYDTDHFPRGNPLKLSKVEPTLANMLKVGGVCRHQAYFAMHVAKSHGIPSVYVTGVGSEVSHAWLGFLEVSRTSAQWNFDSGRFGEYAEITGQAADPQSGQRMPDGRLALLARACLDREDDRRFAAALADAAARVGAGAREVPPPARAAREPREFNVQTRLELLEAAVRECPAYAPAWDQVVQLAADKGLPGDRVKDWADAAVELCGREFPDFAVETLSPLISCVEDVDAQDKLWDWAFSRFSGADAPAAPAKRSGAAKPPPKRTDLAAQIRFSQASMWDGANRPAKAWEAYQDVITRFPNNGRYIVDAAAGCERLLRKDAKTAREVAVMYGEAFRKVRKPGAGTSPEFLVASSYVKLGTKYATVLEEAGDKVKADAVRRQLPGR